MTKFVSSLIVCGALSVSSLSATASLIVVHTVAGAATKKVYF